MALLVCEYPLIVGFDSPVTLASAFLDLRHVQQAVVAAAVCNTSAQSMATSILPLLQRQHIIALLKSKKRFAALHWLKAIRALMKYSVEVGLRPDNPANGIRLPNLKTDGYHAWTEVEIEQFQERHGLGTKGAAGSGATAGYWSTAR